MTYYYRTLQPKAQQIISVCFAVLRYEPSRRIELKSLIYTELEYHFGYDIIQITEAIESYELALARVYGRIRESRYNT